MNDSDAVEKTTAIINAGTIFLVLITDTDSINYQDSASRTLKLKLRCLSSIVSKTLKLISVRLLEQFQKLGFVQNRHVQLLSFGDFGAGRGTNDEVTGIF